MPKLPEDIKNWLEIESSNIKALSYNKDEKILKVKFNNGSVYKYENVGPQLVEDFINADSKGSFFHKRIRIKDEKYPYERIASQLPRSDFIGRMLAKTTMLEQWNKQNG